MPTTSFTMRMSRLIALIVLLWAVPCYAITVSSGGVNGVGGFPAVLSSAGATYLLTEDISCPQTCFTLNAANVTLDLNGHTMTYGAANNPGMLNTGFESWADADTPQNWTILSGTATRYAATNWGTYDAKLSAIASIKSDTVTLNAGQTYLFYAVIKGYTSDSVTITLRRASDDAVLATDISTGPRLDRGEAIADGVIATTENEYKPSVNTDVYLQIDCSGAQVKRLAMADIKPAKHFGVVRTSYWVSSIIPDIPSSGYVGNNSDGFTVRNGTIQQGAGSAVKSNAIWLSNTAATITAPLAINVIGANSGYITLSSPNNKTITIDGTATNTTSELMFNRRHPVGGIDILTPTGTTTITVQNCTMDNDPENAIRFAGALANMNAAATTLIKDNTLRNKEILTEGYAISMWMPHGVEIQGNTITPVRGRGILVDARSRGVTIHHNTITGIYEIPNWEYPKYNLDGSTASTPALEAVGIRVRNWGNLTETHNGLQIYNNTISGSTDASGVHAVYGLNLTLSTIDDSVEIWDNDITVNTSQAGFWAAGIAFQGSDTGTSGTSWGDVLVHNNRITSNDEGLHIGGNDGAKNRKLRFYSNEVIASGNALAYYSSGTFADQAIYCNKITGGATGKYPFDFKGTLTGIGISNNSIVSNNPSSYTASLTTNEATDIIFCGSGTPTVTGGGTVGTEGAPCTYGTTDCYLTAGLGYIPEPPDPPDPPATGKRSVPKRMNGKLH